MMFRMLFISVPILFLLSCTDSDSTYEATRFYSERDATAFVEKLESNNIPFKAQNNMIFYPVSYRDKVRQLAAETIEAAHRPTAYTFSDPEEFNSFKVLLMAEGVGFGETSLDKELVIFLKDKSDAEKASKIYSELQINIERKNKRE